MKRKNIEWKQKMLESHCVAHTRGMPPFFFVFLSLCRSQLVILSEYLPHSTEPDIIVQLIEPPEPSLHLVEDITAESDLIDYVLNHSLLTSENSKVSTHIFHCKKTHQVVWALWIQPGQTLRFKYSYRILWPEGHEINIYWRQHQPYRTDISSLSRVGPYVNHSYLGYFSHPNHLRGPNLHFPLFGDDQNDSFIGLIYLMISCTIWLIVAFFGSKLIRSRLLRQILCQKKNTAVRK